jgi:hypothetical protein
MEHRCLPLVYVFIAYPTMMRKFQAVRGAMKEPYCSTTTLSVVKIHDLKFNR